MKKITFLAAAIGILVAAPTTTMAEDSFTEALTSGKVSFSARARYESVSQDNTRKDADAFTLRTTLGYKTGDFHGFGAFIEFEDVTELGSESYDSNPSGTDGNNDYSVVADPDGTEVNQAFLSYNGFNTEFKLGRQEITYRGAPFHRYIGNILWRQNHQTFDAFSFTNSSFDKTK
ncbi:MAG: hypothetical protein OEY48_02840, partial [Gammaproteobacteria bacterium]|nr:hypothetical protein [Gammaproteobacteria bacterium]